MTNPVDNLAETSFGLKQSSKPEDRAILKRELETIRTSLVFDAVIQTLGTNADQYFVKVFQAPEDFQDEIEAYAVSSVETYTVDALVKVRFTPLGTCIILPHSSMLFGVKISQTGGAQGSKTSAATYTYLVTDITGEIILGEEVSLARPRPYGRVDVQFDNSFGTAFYDQDGHLRLWDAGEVPKIGDC